MAQYLAAENERCKRGEEEGGRGSKADRLSPRTVIRRAFVPAEGEAEERQLAVVDRSGRVGAGRLFGHVVQVLGREIGRVGQRAACQKSVSSQILSLLSLLALKEKDDRGEHGTHRSCGIKGDSILRIVVQSTPAKNGCALISSAELRPNRWSAEVTILVRARRGRSA
jgi:hypothetical protein